MTNNYLEQEDYLVEEVNSYKNDCLNYFRKVNDRIVSFMNVESIIYFYEMVPGERMDTW